MLTVLFATRNRSQTLASVLESFACLQAPPSGWKLVVVDNGSTDGTAEIIASFRARLPVTYVFEGKAGKNEALNTGLQHLEGDLAVFTDDDVFPHPDWLIQLRTAVDTYRDYSIFGGAVRPRWEVAPPQWMTWVNTEVAFAITDPQMAEGPTKPWFIFGPNMAIRAEVFNAGIRFDTSIGPRGKNYPMGSETELVLRLDRLGHRTRHVQRAVVEHLIGQHQMNKSWVLGRATRYGRGSFRMAQTPYPIGAPYCFGVPIRLVPKLFKKAVKTIIAWLSFDERAGFSSRWEFNYLLGHIIEARIMRRDRRAKNDAVEKGT